MGLIKILVAPCFPQFMSDMVKYEIGRLCDSFLEPVLIRGCLLTIICEEIVTENCCRLCDLFLEPVLIRGCLLTIICEEIVTENRCRLK